MRALTASQLIEVWERGVGHPAADQALLLLAVACPEMTWDALATLSLGQRDECLLELRERTLGYTLKGATDCCHCGERLEFTLNTAQLGQRGVLSPTEGKKASPLFELSCDGLLVRFRSPNSSDLAAAAQSSDLEAARRTLAARCIVDADRADTAVAVEDLSDEILGQLSQSLAECDPATERLLDLRCPACGHENWPALDIASFFWSEISALAERLLREVHVLARAYGWRESDILAMGAARRQYYLELVG
jgi:hypothetical protein